MELINRVARIRRELILDISLSEDGDTEFGDLIMDSDSPSPWETVTFGLLQHTLRSILAELTPREAGIISLRDYLGDE